jgi:hypothetical protein
MLRPQQEVPLIDPSTFPSSCYASPLAYFPAFPFSHIAILFQKNTGSNNHVIAFTSNMYFGLTDYKIVVSGMPSVCLHACIMYVSLATP